MGTPDDSSHLERWEEDIADSKAAHALEDRARAALLATESGAKLLAAAMKDIPRVAKPTRAGPANALRAAVKQMACDRSKGCPHCLATRLVKGADGLYWQMVLRHDPLIRKNTNIAAIAARPPLAPGSEEWEDLYQLQRIGFYRGALRYDPDRKCRFITMAVKWGAAYVQNHRDRGAVRIPPDKASRVCTCGAKPHTDHGRSCPAGRDMYPTAKMTSLDEIGLTSSGEDSASLGEFLPDPASLELDAMFEDREQFERAVALFGLLSARTRYVMEALYLRGALSYAEIAHDLGVTIADVEAMEAIGIDRIRRELDEDPATLPNFDEPEPIFGVQGSLFAA